MYFGDSSWLLQVMEIISYILTLKDDVQCRWKSGAMKSAPFVVNNTFKSWFFKPQLAAFIIKNIQNQCSPSATGIFWVQKVLKYKTNWLVINAIEPWAHYLYVIMKYHENLLQACMLTKHANMMSNLHHVSNGGVVLHSSKILQNVSLRLTRFNTLLYPDFEDYWSWALSGLPLFLFLRKASRGWSWRCRRGGT